MNVQWLPLTTPHTQTDTSYSGRLSPMWHVVLENTQLLKQINDDEDNNTVMCNFQKGESIFNNENVNKEIRNMIKQKKWFMESQWNHFFLHGLSQTTFPNELVNNGKANSMHLLIVMKCFSLFHANKYFFNYFYVFKNGN